MLLWHHSKARCTLGQLGRGTEVESGLLTLMARSAQATHKRRTKGSPGHFRDRTLHSETEVRSDLDVELASRHFTVTGLFTSPSRTAALAAAQEEDPEA